MKMSVLMKETKTGQRFMIDDDKTTVFMRIDPSSWLSILMDEFSSGLSDEEKYAHYKYYYTAYWAVTVNEECPGSITFFTDPEEEVALII